LGASGEKVNSYTINGFVGKGNVGHVYKALRENDAKHPLACKLIRSSSLRPSWKDEVEKSVNLLGLTRIVQYHSHGDVKIGGVEYKFILSEYIDGPNLREFERKNSDAITLEFVEALLRQVLEVLLALDDFHRHHGDLHPGNVLIAPPDPRTMRPELSVKVGDFGIGDSLEGISPKDDYQQLSIICAGLLTRNVTYTKLEGEDRFVYERLVTDFLPKKLVESNPTVGDYVRSPRKLNAILDSYRDEFRNMRTRKDKLTDPFDYLNCEQFGDAFDLLQNLYSDSFPGYDVLLEKTNTILTGPRGCGKTTIFRNLSLKAKLLAKKIDLRQIDHYVGIYYHCTDLFFAFPYLRGRTINDQTSKMVSHYFNLSILSEVLDTLHIAEQVPEGKLSRKNLLSIQDLIAEHFPNFVRTIADADIVGNAMSFVQRQRQIVKKWTEMGGDAPKPLLPIDFILTLTRTLRENVHWMAGVPIYFFLDDYSHPKVSEGVQATLNDIIFNRHAESFFKVSTESITTFYPRDLSGKLLQESREYDVVDLGTCFMDAEQERLMKFLGEVLNNRLENAEKVPPDHKPIEEILGDTEFSYNELARRLQRGDHQVQYKGWPLVCSLCSGDIANILHVVRDVFTEAEYAFDSINAIESGFQDKAIRVSAADFLNTIESAPRNGPILRRIAEAFGHVARHYLKTRSSKNEDQIFPFQAIRLELLEYPRFEPDSLELEIYEDLIKYAVFVRDLRGKSQRGDVVPRLYLRRLLIPTFLLTPNKRDSVRVEPKDFFLLLTKPDEFEEKMKKKIPRGTIRAVRPVPKEQSRLS
jgi:predicted Ser/Thr protein kinase